MKRVCLECGKEFDSRYYKMTCGRACAHDRMSRITKGRIPVNLDQIHLARRGTKHRPDTIAKMSLAHRGKRLSPDHRAKLSVAHRGAASPTWKGGITPINAKARTTGAYKEWRRKVLERDGCCVDCGADENLHADHIQPFAHFPELRCELSNGRTLCAPCHRKTPTFARRELKQVA